ncbi:tetratricopeptide repeat protein [Polaromonas sp.]|uniref:tetratricopeptide repeat protein n=1 Tax=Polaromonas sp. TaxID=1869339 RepID=UPI003BAA128A
MRDDGHTLRQRGNKLLAAGKLTDATDCYRRAAEVDPDNAATHVNLGYGLLELGDLNAAGQSLRRALELDTNLVDAHFLLGQVLARSDAMADAVQCFEKAVTLKPDFDFAWFELAGLYAALGRPSVALDAFSRVLALNPGFSEAASAKAGLLIDLQHWQEVLAITQPRLGLASVFPVQQAYALNGLGRGDEALVTINEVLAQYPDELRAWDAKTAILLALGRKAQALEIQLQILKQQPALEPAQFSAAEIYIKMGHFQEALDIYTEAVRQRPDNVNALSNMAYTLLHMHRTREALEACDRGLALSPGHARLRSNKAFGHLLLGELHQGWAEYEWRLLEPSKEIGLPDSSLPVWRGEPVAGKTVFLHPEQGLGDTLQMLRYVPLLAAKGAKVLLRVPAAIRPLCVELQQHCTLINATPPAGQYDYHCSMMSLPSAFRTALENIPPVPYLCSDARLCSKWEARLGPRNGPRIGLVWSGNVTQLNDTNRSMALAPLLAILPKHCQLVSLQKDVRDSDMPALESSAMFHAGAELTTFAETAALADLMDLVISVDTSVCHLSGALGKPTWLMLAYFADWRWLRDRDDSPWYSSVRLFRQAGQRDWALVLDQIAAELALQFPAS